MRVWGKLLHPNPLRHVLTPTTIETGRFFSELNPAAPIVYSTIIMPWPTHMCTTTLTGIFGLLFGDNCLQKETHIIRHKHPTKSCHAMAAMPCLGLVRRGERAHVWGKVLHPNPRRHVLTTAAIRTGRFFSKLDPAAPIIYSTIIMPWPTSTCTKRLTGTWSLLFGGQSPPKRDMYEKAQARPSKPLHAMATIPYPGLVRRGEVS